MNRFQNDVLSPLGRNSSAFDSSDVSETNVFEISNLNFNLTSFADTQGTRDILSPIDSVFLAENLRDTAESSKKNFKLQFSPEDFATKPVRHGEIESYSIDQNDVAIRDELGECSEATTVMKKRVDESSKDISSEDSYKSCSQDYLEKLLRIPSLDSEKNAHVPESLSGTEKKDKNLLDFRDKKSNSESQDADVHESSSKPEDIDYQESSSEFKDADYWKNYQNFPEELSSGLCPYKASIEKMVHDCVSEECAKLRQIMFSNMMGFYRQLNKMKQETDYNHLVITERLFKIIEELLHINSILKLQLKN